MKTFFKKVGLVIVSIIFAAVMLVAFNTCENFNNNVLGIDYMGRSVRR
jgi:hypothetical protein